MAMASLKYISKLLTLLFLIRGGEAEFLSDAILPVTTPNFTQNAHSIGLPCEEFQITTEDGYILDMFHIPGDPQWPVLMQSGNFGTADDLIYLGNTSLPYVLHEEDYDLWVGNVRGSRYGRRHVTLDPDDDQFWDFSFHEFGYFDTPAMVDFVLQKTKAPALSSIGWSYGTAVNFIMCAERPEYNKKVKVIIALAPIAYLHHSPAFYLAANTLTGIVNTTLSVTDTNEVLGEKSSVIALLRRTCSTVPVAYGVCLNAAFTIFGFDFEQIKPELAPVIFQHYPSSTSRKNLLHEAQTVQSKRFQQFDYGAEENMKRYGSKLPKLYDMSKNKVNIVLISGKNDMASTLEDVALLKPQIVNLDEHIILKPKKFNHLDHVAGKDTHKVLYKPIVLEKLNKYNKACFK